MSPHLSSPRSAGHTSRAAANPAPLSFHPRVARGRHCRLDRRGCLGPFIPAIRGAHDTPPASYGPPFPSIPAIRGAHTTNPASGVIYQLSSPHSAGHTRPKSWRCPTWSFHPRIRGADLCYARAVSGLRLSSPHTRGRLGEFTNSGLLLPFIPAIRGADHGGLQDRGDQSLSSPHTRGRPGRPLQSIFAHPFIPAYAGQTNGARARPCSRPFHPRIRGADSRDWFTLLCPNLSSPHTRGRLTSCGMGHRGHPFIPAYAGQTPYEHPRHVSIAFHPRIRGADAALWYGRRPLSLSSPHTRGRRAWYTNRIGHYPFIPAYAGQTIRRGRSSRPPIFHPRIRGADTHIHESAHALYLSSPHTRGRLHGGVGARSPYPFIPAYAGQTLIVKERNYLIFLCRLTVLPTSKNPSLSTIL